MAIVGAVLVAFNRDNLLERSLKHTLSQTRPPDHVYVVDNANLSSTKKLVESAGAVYLSGAVENGSAGGFAIGIHHAVNTGCDYIWTLDDDGYPHNDCLKNLLEVSQKSRLDVCSPLSLSQEDHSQTANPYLFGVTKVTSAERIQRKVLRRGVNKVQFYNGMLMTKELVEIIGLPKKELFLRGDELDYLYRAKKSGAEMGLVTTAFFYHPSGAPEFANNRNSLLGVIIPSAPNKKYYQFRNRGYLVRKHHLYINGVYDWLRYPIFFLIFPGKNLGGFLEWARLWTQGFMGVLTPYKSGKD
jgi:rhamnopyranosyl-N-acetylglucosaminyl-diphospho-decaprenol beta-1,3/1,4-galactofuranosyltransferase